MQGIKKLLGPKLLLGLASIYTILLTLVSVAERGNLPELPIFPMQDKVAHVLAYTILGGLWGVFWMRKASPARNHPYFTVLILGAFIYGTIIEVIQQHFTFSRSGDIYDIFANLFGMLLGAILGRIFYNKILSHK